MRVEEALRSKRIVNLCVNAQRRVCITVFRGVERDYVLNESMCSCPDYIINVVGRGRARPCYHIIALRRAVELGKVIEVFVDPGTFEDIVFEIVNDGFSRTLRLVIQGLDSLKE